MDPGELIQERYRLEAPLGRGGMAEVWRATDERLDRPVAIKFLTSRYAEDPEFLVRFFSEAQAVAGISHAHVVRVLDFGSADAGPYLVMELVEGGSLADRAGAPLPVEEAFRIVAEAASGAGAAHQQGVVHRDVKPGNILLTSRGSVKLADFGIATLGAVDHLADTGTAIGSPNYISPEGAQGRAGDPASDVYSLGVVLYELLTGHRPFEAGSAAAVALAHVERTPDPPSSHRAHLPHWVDALVLQALAKDPRDRFADGDAFAAALRAGAGGAPVAQTTAPERSERFSRLAVASVASAAILALGGYLLASPGTSMTPRAEAESESAPTGPTRPSPEPTDTTTREIEAEITSSSAEPSPSASETPTPEPTRTNDADGADDPGDEEETEVDEEPTPEETVVEEEPTPEPTSTPEPSPTPEETTDSEETSTEEQSTADPTEDSAGTSVSAA